MRNDVGDGDVVMVMEVGGGGGGGGGDDACNYWLVSTWGHCGRVPCTRYNLPPQPHKTPTRSFHGHLAAQVRSKPEIYPPASSYSKVSFLSPRLQQRTRIRSSIYYFIPPASQSRSAITVVDRRQFIRYSMIDFSTLLDVVTARSGAETPTGLGLGLDMGRCNSRKLVPGSGSLRFVRMSESLHPDHQTKETSGTDSTEHPHQPSSAKLSQPPADRMSCGILIIQALRRLGRAKGRGPCRVRDVCVGLERPATETSESDARGNGSALPCLSNRNKRGQEEGITGPNNGMYLTTNPWAARWGRRGRGKERKEGDEEVDLAWKLKLSCGLNVISDAYFLKRKEAFLISSQEQKRGFGSVGGCKDVIYERVSACMMSSLGCQTFSVPVRPVSTGGTRWSSPQQYSDRTVGSDSGNAVAIAAITTA
ncbi:hypothetical protein EDB92DRAFT_2021468 [Lactarius akahatsu]|uniref:Uncharacterized protein n=1 Tax=Lactarius akahatsu TaxID=416441 RepID=A0AAD4LCF1_9AGAM|nr:hypothetical protein EDB92DRAFT_2021468 [Lactarius akahatsu]